MSIILIKIGVSEIIIGWPIMYIAAQFGSPFPGIINKADVISLMGLLMFFIGFVSTAVGIILWIWSAL